MAVNVVFQHVQSLSIFFCESLCNIKQKMILFYLTAERQICYANSGLCTTVKATRNCHMPTVFQTIYCRFAAMIFLSTFVIFPSKQIFICLTCVFVQANNSSFWQMLLCKVTDIYGYYSTTKKVYCGPYLLLFQLKNVLLSHCNLTLSLYIFW